MPSYRRLCFDFEGDGELLIGALWEAGTLGVELGETGRLTAYFDDDESGGAIDWRRYGARLVDSGRLESRDWLESYRAQARPIEVGSRLVVDPREPELSEAAVATKAGAQRRRLRLPARNAFGTGSHPSTRLALELMEEIDLTDKTVLDVGFGSGILSFAAQLWGAGPVVGVEIDLESALVGGQNRRLNGLAPSWVAGDVSALQAAGRFDLALVNVLPERVADDLESIRGMLRLGGAAVFSGIVDESVASTSAELERAGFSVVTERTAGEWVALLTGAP